MATVVEICNRALQKLGSLPISALSDNIKAARACNACYEPLRDALLRRHVWNFSIKQADLAADATSPTWGRARRFAVPADFIRLAEQYPEDNDLSIDYQIENGYIVSDLSDPIYIRYVYRVTDPNLMDPLFREALSSLMAVEMCEIMTQSNTKKSALKDEFKEAIAEARRANAFEQVSQVPPTDDWVSCRA